MRQIWILISYILCLSFFPYVISASGLQEEEDQFQYTTVCIN